MVKRADWGLDELQFRAWRAFLYAHATVVRRLDQELAASRGLTFSQFEVLSWLRMAGEKGLRMSELASRVILSRSGVTRAVDQLEKKRLVERCVFSGDKRGSVATLTAEGKAFLRTATRVHLDGVREHFLNHMSSTELKELACTMEAILDGEKSPLPQLPTARR